MNLKDILKDPLFQQVAPLIVLFSFPAAIFFASQTLRHLSLHRLIVGWYLGLRVGLESMGLSWLWSGSSAEPSSPTTEGKKHKKKTSSSASKSKVLRTRAEQIALTRAGKENHPNVNDDDDQYYPGLVNISGTYCFMNSTLQALSSLTYLQPHVEAIQTKAEQLDVPTPVIDALRELFQKLNTPKSSYHSLRPQGIIDALSAPPPQNLINGKPANTPRISSSLFNSREHQDAQELFQLVSECIKNEMMAVDREGLKDRGIAGVLDLAKPVIEHEDLLEGKNSKSVFDGLTANRRSCVVCGYTEAVMHFGFDNWQLAVPRLATSCRLEDCLEDYTRLEILKDCICRKCSMLATHKRLLLELNTLQDALDTSTPADPSLRESILASSSSMPSSNQTKPKPSTSKKRRYKEVKRMEQRIRDVIAQGRIEDEALVEGIRLEKVVSPASTKQAMIARPPPVLALHLNRSVHYGQYAAKNTIKVYFPEVLDLTPYTTSGSLSTIPTSSISSPPPIPPQANNHGPSKVSKRPTTPTQETYFTNSQRVIYRLSAVVCHYGQHSFGHYICYRRKPRRVNGKWDPPTLIDPLRLEIDGDDEDDNQSVVKKKAKSHTTKIPNYAGSSTLGEARYFWEDHAEELGAGRGWLRISDDAVSECGIESVLAETSGAFMLYYEKAVHPRTSLYQSRHVNGMAANNHSRSEPISIPQGQVHEGHSNAEYDGDTIDNGNDQDGDALSIGSEETLKPKITVVDLNGSVGSLISEVGIGVMKQKGKDKLKDPKKENIKSEQRESTSTSMYLPGPPSTSSSLSSTGFMPRIVRSVNARRRNTPDGSVISSGSPGSSTLGSSYTATTPLSNGSASHAGGLDHQTLVDMTASAPSILPSSKVTHSPSKSNKGSSHGIGSKSTKIHQHAKVNGVKV